MNRQERVDMLKEPDFINTSATLKGIQSLEDKLINQKLGSESLYFTEMIYGTKFWVKGSEPLHISPYKIEMDKDVELVAYYIECGMRTDQAIMKIGKNVATFMDKLTDTHKYILSAARKQRKHNRNY